MADSKLIVTPAPHLRGNINTPGLMRDVVIALLPACVAGVYFFGVPALISLISGVVGCVGAEFVFE